MKRIPVFLVEDHMVVREGLRILLDAVDDIEVVGEADNGREAVDLVRKLCPSVVVMDIAMPNLNGIEAARQILKSSPAVKILMLSAHSDDVYIEKVFLLGAMGYVTKRNSAHVLVKAIHEVHNGKKYFSPAILKRLENLHRTSLDGKGRKKSDNRHLTSREEEVLQLIAEGEANKQIAFELGISIKTVEKHRQHLMKKLDIHDTAGLTRYAISSGSVEK